MTPIDDYARDIDPEAFKRDSEDWRWPGAYGQKRRSTAIAKAAKIVQSVREEQAARIQHLMDALRPFVVMSGTEAAKMIDRDYSGLKPIQVTVTKFQFQAARDAIQVTRDDRADVENKERSQS